MSAIGRPLSHLVLLSLLGAAFSLPPPALAAAGASGRPFTVEDAIELSHFVSAGAADEDYPHPSPLVSPDGRSFLVVTQRGLLAGDRIESTIWLFDHRAVVEHLRHPGSAKPLPRLLAQLSATSNMQVISAVRWSDDSTRVSFLGKDGSPYQRLFVADLKTGAVAAVTREDEFVSGYDLRGDTIAYTTLILEVPAWRPEPELVAAGGKGLEDLLHPERPALADAEPETLASYAVALHVRRNGRELPLRFTLRGKELKLFASSSSVAPPLALSPDGNLLITLVPVAEVLPGWEAFATGPGMDFLRLKPGDPRAVAEGNLDKPLQFALVDLRTGEASPLVEAPAARSLGHYAPTRAFWLADSRRAILCNTFLPLAAGGAASPVVAVVDVATRSLQPIKRFQLPDFHASRFYRWTEVSWDTATSELTLGYRGQATSDAPPSETYALRAGKWIQVPRSYVPTAAANDELELRAEEAFDRSPALSARLRGAPAASVVWDPNLQLASLALGRVTLYHWHDREGTPWSGLLALPPSYDPQHRYPLVIQTHGYRLDQYFADGIFTTGSGGRALTAKGIVVLQMDMPLAHIFTAADAPFELGGFEAVIAQLAQEGVIDPRRVGVIGFSFTCFHALYALTRHPDLFAAAAITDGNNMSYSQYLFDDAEGAYQRISEAVNGGVPWGPGLLKWAQNAPDFNLEKVRTPLLISALEKGALLRQWEPYAGLRKLGKPVDLLWLREENATHVLVRPRHRYLSQQSAVDWFDFWLNGKEDANPEKAGQYARWRELRKRQE